ncbi:MAG: sigma-70 family RNA polymerase sigma factor [Candidatus Aminicenantes bacterium]|nr:sigma-70 family RNA polymerase sigma factor [Candidatus Aminicenantes bacterium]
MPQSPPAVDLDRMIEEFRPKIGFKVRRALGSANPDWEDVVNEILTQVLDKVRSGEFRGESSIGTFIYTITIRRIADYIRQKTRVLRHVPEPGTPPDPIDEAERDQRLTRLAEAVAALAPKYKSVLELYYFRELSREETARRLGISPAKVSERTNYAQKLLRRMLGSDFSIFGPPRRLK